MLVNISLTRLRIHGFVMAPLDRAMYQQGFGRDGTVTPDHDEAMVQPGRSTLSIFSSLMTTRRFLA
jgi:hypothetical protein